MSINKELWEAFLLEPTYENYVAFGEAEIAGGRNCRLQTKEEFDRTDGFRNQKNSK